MADTNSADTQPRRDVRGLRRYIRLHHESRTFLAGNLATDRATIQAARQNLPLRTGSLTTPPNHSHPLRALPTEAMPTPLAPAERNVTAPARAQRRSRKPVTTLVSMLPKTTYNEADETEGTVRSPTYVRVQCQLLQWLGLHASDTLTVQQAHSWTENIAKDKHPQAKDALRLCYYMRSQGFDTYAEFQKNKMSLYIANQDPEVGSPMPELLYWNQNFLNSELAHEVRTVPVLSGARRERRNALPSDLRHPTAQELLGSLRTVDAAGTAANRARSANNPAVAGRGGHGQVTEDNGRENGNDQPTMGSPAARIDAARAELETLLLSNFPDTAAIDAAISQVAELNGQGS